MLQASNDTSLPIARSLVAAGISVIPWRNGTKEPAYHRLPVDRRAGEQQPKPTWAPFAEHLPTDADLIVSFADGTCGIAVVGGKVSGGLVVLDIESMDVYEPWRAFA